MSTAVVERDRYGYLAIKHWASYGQKPQPVGTNASVWKLWLTEPGNEGDLAPENLPMGA